MRSGSSVGLSRGPSELSHNSERYRYCQSLAPLSLWSLFFLYNGSQTPCPGT